MTELEPEPGTEELPPHDEHDPDEDGDDRVNDLPDED